MVPASFVDFNERVLPRVFVIAIIVLFFGHRFLKIEPVPQNLTPEPAKRIFFGGGDTRVSFVRRLLDEALDCQITAFLLIAAENTWG